MALAWAEAYISYVVPPLWIIALRRKTESNFSWFSVEMLFCLAFLALGLLPQDGVSVNSQIFLDLFRGDSMGFLQNHTGGQKGVKVESRVDAGFGRGRLLEFHAFQKAY